MTDVRFLLIQENKVVDAADRPLRLNWWAVRAFAGWRVAIGGVNEFGEREIVGIVAEVADLNTTDSCCRITSEYDGYNRLIGNYPSPTKLVESVLERMYSARRFSDLANLPEPVEIWPATAMLSASN